MTGIIIGIYLPASLIIGILFYFLRKPSSQVLLTLLFIALQWTLTVFEFLHRDVIQLDYFTSDALATLFLGVISIVCIPAFYHSFIYFSKHPYKPREQGMYFAAMVILIASLSAAYLSNHIGITWVFVELTTLSASALIYHRRSKLTLEGTWKYIFICSISITLVFIGVLFVTVAAQQQGITELFYRNLSASAGTHECILAEAGLPFHFYGIHRKSRPGAHVYRGH